MLAALTSIIFAVAGNTPVHITSSRVMSDIDVYISDSRVGATSIYLGPCNGIESEDPLFIRFVDSRSEADLIGYIVDRPERAERVFCTS